MSERKGEDHAKLSPLKKAGSGGASESQSTAGSMAAKPAASAGSTEPMSTGAGSAGASSTIAGSYDAAPAAVARPKQRYLIGIRQLPGILWDSGVAAGESGDAFLHRFQHTDGVEILRHLGSKSPARQTNGSSQPVLVALLDDALAQSLRANAPAHIVIERDLPLNCATIAVFDPLNLQYAAQSVPFPRASREFRCRVVGNGDRPLANALVTLYGQGFPVQALTDSAGHARLQVPAMDGTDIAALYVRPAADHWERYIQSPPLDAAEINIIRLKPIGRAARGIPGQRPYRWGQRVMKFDRVATDWNGAGIKIGLIDSGCDSAHPALRHVTRGIDLTRNHDAETWKSDELGQGTHCAGLIAAADPDAAADILGCASESELHIFKVVPGGHCSDLIEALDHCIARGLDLVQIGVGVEPFCELAAQKMAQARRHGIVCVAPAGNTAAPVSFPGNVPGVLTVAAIGKLGEYPLDSRHAYRTLPQAIPYSRLYATNFSAWGPQVGVCAPGVAIISSVPGGGLSAWDGTAMAASHVVGFAALLLAHHPLLQNSANGARGEQRVALLMDLVRAAAVPCAHVDPAVVGAGMPDLEQVASPPWTGQWPRPPLLGAVPGDPMSALLQMRAAGLWV